MKTPSELFFSLYPYPQATSNNTSPSRRVGTQAKWDNASEILIAGSGNKILFSNSRALLTSIVDEKTQTAMSKAEPNTG